MAAGEEQERHDGAAMALSFPNLSRSYEPKQHRIRFWGYDSAIEVTFFIETATLAKIHPGADADEEALLEAFDSAIDRIHWVACRVYGRRRDLSCVHLLDTKDF